MRRVFSASIAALGVIGAATSMSACEEKGAPPPEVRVNTFRGVLEQADDIRAFHPDTGEGPWWLSTNSKLQSQLAEYKVARDQTQQGQDVFIAEIELTGRFDDKGAGFGHMGAYSAELRARKLISVRPIDAVEAEALIQSYRATLSQDHSGN